MKVFSYPKAFADKYLTQGWERWPFADRDGLEIVSDPDEADLLWAGRYHNNVSWLLKENRFDFYKGRESKHVFDYEGDWYGFEWPEWMKPSILIVMNAYGAEQKKKDGWKFMPRPPCSRLLMKIIDDGPDEFTRPKYNMAAFIGQPDPYGHRERVRASLETLPNVRWAWNPFWGAVLDPTSDVTTNYINVMQEYAFALCPGGAGHHIIRQYEACAYGRIPIMIADAPTLGDDFYDLSFMHVIRHDAPAEEIRENVRIILNQSATEIHSRCEAARRYFDYVVRPYFKDPTGYFFQWLKRHNLP